MSPDSPIQTEGLKAETLDTRNRSQVGRTYHRTRKPHEVVEAFAS